MALKTLLSNPEENNIFIIYSSQNFIISIGSCSFKKEDRFYIVLSNELEEKDIILHLIYGISHCCSDSLYDLYSSLDVRIQCDRRARLWAEQNLFSKQASYVWQSELNRYAVLHSKTQFTNPFWWKYPSDFDHPVR